MNNGIFYISLLKAEALLKYAKLFREKGVKHTGEVSSEFKNASIKESYFNAYKVAIKNLDYDYLLKDESFFQFSYQETAIVGYPMVRFAYFQNPQDIVSYEEYLEEELQTTYNEVGEIFMEEYGQYVAEAELNSNSTTIRYDCDVVAYRPLIHASSHLHIGNGENIRIPCSKTFTPLMFVIFVIKHIYYIQWKNMIDDYENFDKHFFDVAKKQCSSINHQYWKQDPEAKEFFFS